MRGFLYVLVVLLCFGVAYPIADGARPRNRPKTTLKPFKHSCPSGDFRERLVIHHLAVGQGDSTFIRTPNGVTVLIDGGNPNRGIVDIIPTLKKCYGIRTLQYVVATHFDKDHLGGLAEIMEALKPTKAVYDPGDDLEKRKTKPIKKYRAAADKTELRSIPKLGNSTITGDKDVDFTVVAVNGRYGTSGAGRQAPIFKRDGKTVKDANAISVAMVVSFGSFDYFIGGDLTGSGGRHPDVESYVAELVGDIDVLKANHHGSDGCNNKYFLNTLKPEHVVISVGTGGLNMGTYHLPSAAVLDRLNDMSFVRNIFQTSAGESLAPKSAQEKVINAEGDIIVVADEDSFTIYKKEYKTDKRFAFE